MSNDVHVPGRNKSSEELKLEEEARIAYHKQTIAEAEYKATKAKKDAEKLLAPEEPQGEQAQAELQRTISEAKLATIQARRDIFKGPDIDSPTGKITTNDGVFIETRILIHETLSKTLREFVKEFYRRLIEMDKKRIDDNLDAGKEEKSITLVIYNPSDLPALEMYSSAKAQLDEMENAYTRANNRAKEVIERELSSDPAARTLADPLLIGYVGTGILKTIAGIVSLFRTTTDFKNSDLSTDETTIVALLVNAIYSEKKNWEVFSPSVFPINTVKISSAPSPFMTKLNEIHSLNKSAEDLVDKIQEKIKRLEDQLAEEDIEANKKKIKDLLAKHTLVLRELENLDTAYNQLQTMLATADSQTNTPSQSLIMRAERLTAKLNEPDVFTLKIVATSKGSNRITENLWRNASITHSAGTELSCLVFGNDGNIVFADSRYEYIPYTKPENISKKSFV